MRAAFVSGLLLLSIASDVLGGAKPPPGFEVESYRGWRWASPEGESPPSGGLVRYIENKFGEVRARLGVHGPSDPLVIYCPDRRRFEHATIAMGGTRPAEWAAALAFPSRGVIILNGSRRPFTPPEEYLQTVAHEIVHVVLGVGLGRVPRWYHEGVAQYLSGEQLDEEQGSIIAGWARRGEIMPLSDLDGYLDRTHHRAGIFYRQSLSFVQFASRRHGEEIHRELIRRVQAGGGFREAFREASGVDLEVVEADWHAWLASQFSFVRLVIGLLKPFSLVALLCFAGFLYQRFRRRRALRRMAEEEADEPDETPIFGPD